MMRLTLTVKDSRSFQQSHSRLGRSMTLPSACHFTSVESFAVLFALLNSPCLCGDFILCYSRWQISCERQNNQKHYALNARCWQKDVFHNWLRAVIRPRWRLLSLYRCSSFIPAPLSIFTVECHSNVFYTHTIRLCLLCVTTKLLLQCIALHRLKRCKHFCLCFSLLKNYLDTHVHCKSYMRSI